ncbi:MAG: GNAT family N-acetyltransferase [Candidatus Promineifilaceae bacterium]
MSPEQIEQAALNAWPGLQTLLYDRWVVRFSKGYTKRANSVTPLWAGGLPLDEKIAYCETLYAQQNLPIVFRLPGFSADSPTLDHALAQRNYRQIDLTNVQTTDLATQRFEPSTNVLVMDNLSDWLHIFHQFEPKKALATHQEMLEAIVPATCPMIFQVAGQPVACGLGVLDGSNFGLFDIITDENQRRKGYGKQLVTSMLAWAQQNGATSAYLQVMVNNPNAIRLYENLGFQTLYQYWYRVQTN